MAWGWGAAVAGGAVGGAVSRVFCVGSSLLFDGELPTQGKLAGAVTSGIVSGGIVAGCASGDPTFIGAVAIGAAAGGLGAAAGSVLEQGIDHGKVDPGKVIHDGVIGAAGGLIGAGLGKAIGGSVGNGSLRVPTGMAPAINLNGTLTYVLTHTDIQQKALVMAGVMAAATQLTAQAARGLAMAVQGGSNGDPATEMAAKEADNVVAPSTGGPLQGSGGPGKVYEIPGSELTTGQPYIGKTKQPTVADRMKGKDHRAKSPTGDAPKASTLAENLTEQEMAGVEALLIEQRGLENLTNKIPGLNPTLPKNQPRLDAGRRVLGQE